ncbi:alpha-galactosidase [Schleiferilactobacillus shenzhenensis]|uniref:Alpha-galactosidase n=1 Tax=Schleiferilactobacillus shenzhenensis LY-73 TaxID=1231336 RepID=U4TQT9_9LACO|nr:alpha-galactosidase [Schleiferilactobacillus shenzhenensis]ERL64278.1 AgaR [Schleiferilactobacillus shenzhenensis LY-73]
MIEEQDKVFYLTTAHTSYWFRVTAHGQLEHLYYGPRLTVQDPAAVAFKHASGLGSTVAYDEDDWTYSLDTIPQEYAGFGRGDFRDSPLIVKMADGTYVSDFVFEAAAIRTGLAESAILPFAHHASDSIANVADGVQTLAITLRDKLQAISLVMEYTVFPASDVIARRVTLHNATDKPLVIDRIMSAQWDMPNRGFSLHSFAGAWAAEMQQHVQRVTDGTIVLNSLTGASSNRQNPGFLLSAAGTTEDQGWAYGVNLMYSGNHESRIQHTNLDFVRIMTGINSQGFHWHVAPGADFETPSAVLTFSAAGLNGVSHHFHQFVNDNVVPPAFRRVERPIVYNNWEATYFRFDEDKLFALAQQAKDLGVECFVIDDGWFGERNDDHRGLGDYTVNREKFPHGLPAFVQRVHELGLKVGLWFEPEMVNEDSDLYRAHPDWAVQVPGREPVRGRHQLVLDLTRQDVQDYISDQVGGMIDATGIDYVKWDMNRHITDMYSAQLTDQAEFNHRYILGLYAVLRRVFNPRPHVLLESCSSGGNRFDLGMLTFGPQIWSSDDTDPIERLTIQQGLSYLYPQSTISAHVSSSPNQQTLRPVPLSTRGNVASFGVLGYEMDLNELTDVERAEIRDQTAFYKQHRALLQFGEFTRHPGLDPDQFRWQVRQGDTAIAGFFQRHVTAAHGYDLLPVTGLAADTLYTMDSKPQRVMLAQFGNLLNYLPEAKGKESVPDAHEHYVGTGALLATGVMLVNQGGYGKEIRTLGDYGSTLYVITPRH